MEDQTYVLWVRVGVGVKLGLGLGCGGTCGWRDVRLSGRVSEWLSEQPTGLWMPIPAALVQHSTCIEPVRNPFIVSVRWASFIPAW